MCVTAADEGFDSPDVAVQMAKAAVQRAKEAAELAGAAAQNALKATTLADPVTKRMKDITDDARRIADDAVRAASAARAIERRVGEVWGWWGWWAWYMPKDQIRAAANLVDDVHKRSYQLDRKLSRASTTLSDARSASSAANQSLADAGKAKAKALEAEKMAEGASEEVRDAAKLTKLAATAAKLAAQKAVDVALGSFKAADAAAKAMENAVSAMKSAKEAADMAKKHTTDGFYSTSTIIRRSHGGAEYSATMTKRYVGDARDMAEATAGNITEVSASAEAAMRAAARALGREIEPRKAAEHTPSLAGTTAAALTPGSTGGSSPRPGGVVTAHTATVKNEVVTHSGGQRTGEVADGVRVKRSDDLHGAGPRAPDGTGDVHGTRPVESDTPKDTDEHKLAGPEPAASARGTVLNGSGQGLPNDFGSADGSSGHAWVRAPVLLLLLLGAVACLAVR
ncbi:hypothetical protein DQ04_09051000 [Trypanosoma grayi]|uniref:hypothetical protein n=1 Tax=Trypanosoma grayi TaxID=71804 RepID=UPI0004F41DA8|nr:hypothetical protein DQ04_09051000 [Trypanosoma grayi]KEG07698.1 hypothetical protein DQ04_09051000 [Trypanosoma grayi]